jgi:adenylate cyclase
MRYKLRGDESYRLRRLRLSSAPGMLTFRTSITLAVMAFIVALAALLIAIQVQALRWATRDAASAYMDATSTKAFGRLQTEITAIASLVRVLATSSSVADSSERTETGPAIPLFKAALQELPQMDSVYAGFENGAWLQVQRIRELNDEQRTRLRATPGANIAIDLVRPTPSGELPMRRIFEDQQGNEVAQLDLWKYGYDPRRRPWYRETMKADRSLVSSPYLAFSIGAPVITVSAPLRGKVPGVLAANLKLDTFSDFVQEQRPGARDRLDFRLDWLAHSPPQFCTVRCRCDDTSIPTAIAKHQGDQLRGRGGTLTKVAWSRPLRGKYP